MNEQITELYVQYHDQLLRYAVANMWDVDESEGLVTDTFIKAMEAAGKGRLPEGVGVEGWLFTVLKHKMIDRSRRMPVSLGLEADLQATEPQAPEDLHSAIEELREAAAARFGELPDALSKFLEPFIVEVAKSVDMDDLVGPLAESTGLSKPMVSRNKQRLQDAWFAKYGLAKLCRVGREYAKRPTRENGQAVLAATIDRFGDEDGRRVTLTVAIALRDSRRESLMASLDSLNIAHALVMFQAVADHAALAYEASLRLDEDTRFECLRSMLRSVADLQEYAGRNTGAQGPGNGKQPPESRGPLTAIDPDDTQLVAKQSRAELGYCQNPTGWHVYRTNPFPHLASDEASETR